MRLTYEDAAGRRVETEALDVSAGGLFVVAQQVTAVGKRLSVDITLPDGSSKWSVLARVIWVRERNSDAGPAGMGVKLIDADENMVAAIGKLVASREATDPGTGGSKTLSRERTVLGVGKAEEQAVAAAPIVTAAPARERTQLGIGGATAVAPEASIPIELVAKKIEKEVPTRRVEVPRIERESSELDWDLVPKAEAEPKPELKPVSRPQPNPVLKPAAVEAPPSETSLAEAGVPRRRDGLWIILLLLVAIGGVGYVFRSRMMLAAFPTAPPQPVTATPTSAPTPASVSAASSVTSAAPPNAAPSASSAPRTGASTSASTSAKPRKPVPSAAGAAAPPHPGAPSGDNPY
jgi:uncharacterized protein (TIGR02266 family)